MASSSSEWPSGAARIGLIASGTAAPVLSGWTACSIAMPKWQSGRITAYAALVLSNTALVFLPFLLYASVCLVLALCYPQKSLRHFGVRFGVYSGVLLSAHLNALLLAVFPALTFWAVITFGVLLPFMLRAGSTFLWRRSRRFRQTLLIVLASVAFLLFVVATFVSSEPLAPSYFVLFGVIVVAWLTLPGWCLMAYLRVARLVYRDYGGHAQFRLSEAMWLITWSGIYMGTWRISVTRALEEYAKLPEKPRCYICTAAARGHSWIVASEEVDLQNGDLVVANLQMRRLKAAEIVVMTIAPGFHAPLRAVYDWLGPRLATGMRVRVFADLAYLALKPIEWCSLLVMGRLMPDFDTSAQRLYRGAKPTQHGPSSGANARDSDRQEPTAPRDRWPGPPPQPAGPATFPCAGGPGLRLPHE
jgi:hypothetical protein